LIAEFEKNKSKLVNNITEYFRNTDFATLTKANGQERAREDIKDIIVETMGVDAESITNVYFLQFIIQG
jgi:flagellar basal body-associated protein FliL